MSSIFLNVWGLQGGLKISETEDKIFLFHFEFAKERNRVFNRQPWYFNRAILVLQEVDALQSPMTAECDTSLLLMAIHKGGILVIIG